MAEGTRLGKIEGELARMEQELRQDKEQRLIFQEKMESQLSKLMEIVAPKYKGSNSSTSNRVFHRDFKVDIPTFDGDNVDDWLFRIEEYFDVANTPEDQHIKIASFHMIEPAYAWYKWMIKNQYTQDWMIFADALQKRFGTNLYDNPREALKELKQQGTVAEYQSQFEALSTKVTGLSEQWLISFFVAGLDDYLKCQLRLAKPTSYPEVVALAHLHEQNYQALKNSLKQPQPAVSMASSRPKYSSPAPIPRPTAHISIKPPESQPHTQSTLPPSNSNPAPAFQPQPKHPYKKFTAAELRKRRRQGLCYYCDEKYNPSHNCQAQCFVLLAPDDLAEVFALMDHETPTKADVTPEVSFNALSGEYHPSTLRLKGYYDRHIVNVLVDSGSTFNFIKPSVAQFLKLEHSTITPFKVFVGSGDFIWCNTKSSGIPVMVQGVQFVVDLYHLNIAAADIVFGVAWLQSLGRVITDYHLNAMEFIYGGQPTILYAEKLL